MSKNCVKVFYNTCLEQTETHIDDEQIIRNLYFTSLIHDAMNIGYFQ